MNPMPMVRSLCSRMDNVILRPGLTLSLSSYDRESGAFTDQKSVSLSARFSMLRGMILLAGAVAAAYGTVCYFRCKERKKIRRAVEEAQRKRRKK